MQINRRRLFGLMGATALTPALPGAAAPMLTEAVRYPVNGIAGAIVGQGGLATTACHFTTTAPQALRLGDLWIQAETFRLHRWDGLQWLDIRPV